MSTPTAELFDRVGDILRSIGEEKQAAARKSADDPGGLEGKSGHPTAKADNLTIPAPEGAMSADNVKVVKATIPGGGTDSVPDVTPEGAPKAEEAQLGDAVSTGKDVQSTVKKPDDKKEGDLGGTSHPANAEHQKFSAASLAAASEDDLYKLAAELGNALAADLANAVQNPVIPATPVEKAAAVGAAVAAATPAPAVNEDAVAAGVISQIVKMADHQADLIATNLAAAAQQLQKEAAEGDEEMPEEDPDEAAADAVPPEDAGAGEGDPAAASDLLAAMSGGGAEAGGVPPDAGAGPGGPPGVGGGADEEQALQQLAMALLELGIDPAMLAQLVAGGAEGAGGPPDAGMPPGAGGPEAIPPELAGAAKMASAVQNFKAAGKFKFTEAKQGSEARHIRDYMKDHILELLRRSQS